MNVDISKIDANFLAGTENGKFWRLPEHLINEVNEGVSVLGQHTSGGRIRFRTDSPYIAYRAKPLFQSLMSHMPLTGSAGTDIFVNGKSCTTFRPKSHRSEWFEGILEIGDEDRDACTMDGAHPNDLGFYRMAKSLLPYIKNTLSLS